MQYTPDRITKLAPNEIFVFGANEAGRHGCGAARFALDKFGAIYGQGDGLQGSSYGISTKDRNVKTLPLHKIQIKVGRFLRFAANNSAFTFLVTQIGCGLAGYNPKDIAPMFFAFGDVPSNVSLPKEFWAFAPFKKL